MLFRFVISAIGLLALPPIALAQQSPTFGGYDCLGDCSGHAAGYDWAQQHNEVDGCPGGNSPSFQEGCQAYFDDPLRGSDEDDQGNVIQR